MRSGTLRAGRGAMAGVATRVLETGILAGLGLGLWWAVRSYDNALGDARYLDGWILAGGFGVQIWYHVVVTRGRLGGTSARRWRHGHILLGLLLIPAFLLHCDISLPDTAFEWALAAGFALLSGSGLFGIYQAWSVRARSGVDARVTLESIPARIEEIAREVSAIVAVTDTGPGVAGGLPAPSYDAWIGELYYAHLQSFMDGRRGSAGLAIGLRRRVQRATAEIDTLSRYVDAPSRAKLARIRALVVEKDRLEGAALQLWLAKAWLMVHVPVTYAMIVLVIAHVVVAYAFSSGSY